MAWAIGIGRGRQLDHGRRPDFNGLRLQHRRRDNRNDTENAAEKGAHFFETLTISKSSHWNLKDL